MSVPNRLIPVSVDAVYHFDIDRMRKKLIVPGSDAAKREGREVTCRRRFFVSVFRFRPASASNAISPTPLFVLFPPLPIYQHTLEKPSSLSSTGPRSFRSLRVACGGGAAGACVDVVVAVAVVAVAVGDSSSGPSSPLERSAFASGSVSTSPTSGSGSSITRLLFYKQDVVGEGPGRALRERSRKISLLLRNFILKVEDSSGRGAVRRKKKR